MTASTVSGDGPAPMNHIQQQIWLQEKLGPHGGSYHVPMFLRIEGQVSVSALQSAVDTVVAANDALRTVFVEDAGVTFQRVLPAVHVAVEQRDLRGHADAEVIGRRQAFRDMRRPFDLEAGPLMRVLVLRTGEESHLVVITVHHICFDGSSMGPFLEQLSSAYNAARLDAQSASTSPRASFVAAVRAEHDDLTSVDSNRDRAWWRAYLGGTPTVLELPSDFPRRPVAQRTAHDSDLEPARRRRTFDGELTSGVRRLGGAHEATPFMTLLAAFAVVLHRQTGQESMLLGSPVSTRRVADRTTVGCFLTTLPLLIDVGGDPTFEELLERVRQSVVAAFTHRRVSFADLVRDRAPDRDASRNPMFQVFFNMLPPRYEPEFDGCHVEWIPTRAVDNQFDLSLYASVSDGRFDLDAVYDADLYRHERVDDLLDQLTLVVRRVVDQPGIRLSDIALATEQAAGPDPRAPLGRTDCGSIVDRLRRHATDLPDRPALIDPTETWTYADLARRTEQLAGRLHELDVSRGDVVGIHAGRSAGTVVAMLAVARLGAAFALFDVGRPSLELAERASLLGPCVWVDAVPPVGAASWATGPAVSLVDAGVPPPEGDLEASDLAYVTFTSGTTGRARRILGTHGPLGHFLDWYTRTRDLGVDDRFSVLSGVGHDPFLRDVLAPLWVGAAAVFPAADVRDTVALSADLRRTGVSVAHLTPTLADALTEADRAGEASGWPALRLVGFGGEALSWHTVRDWAARAPEAQQLNMYGSTETPQAVSVHVAHRPGDAVPADDGPVPLGPGIEEVQLLALAHDRLAAIGEIADIVVRTPHLARYAAGDRDGGFTANPFAPDDPDGVYRTGDLGRLRPDGLIEYLGRVDDQVQIRGYRVEPAEIEAVVLEQPDVRRTVVLAEPDPRGGARLVCYLVVDGARPDVPRLRAVLAERLPDHKVPAAYVVLDALPLTANGKVDRAALRGTGREERAVDAYVAPTDGAEQVLAAIWAEVLGVERVGVHDDFFALGGHSLLLIRILTRVRRELMAELTLLDLFAHPTVRGLAELIAGSAPAAVDSPIPRTRAAVPAPLLPLQRNLWLEDQFRPGDSAYNMPAVLRVAGALDTTLLDTALDAVARRHTVLRTRFVTIGGEPHQEVVEGVRIRVREIDRTGDHDGALADAMRETRLPFDLATGPLLRALVIRLGAQENLLVLTAHHIAFDVWSTSILLADLSTAYRQALVGGSADLGDDTLQVSDVARWQRDGDGEGRRADLLAWWSAYLDGVPTVLDLPTDRPRPAVLRHEGARHRVEIGEDDARALRETAQSLETTVFMVLLAAFGALLGRRSRQDRLLLGSPVSVRDRTELEGLVGCFLNVVPLAIDLRGAPTFAELVARTTQSALGAVAHQDVDLSTLVDEYVPDRDPSRPPLIQAMFALNHGAAAELDVPGLSSRRVEVSTANVQFDLNLRMTDTGSAIVGWLDHDSDLFDASTVERMMEHFVTLVTTLARDPSNRPSTVDLLSRVERSRVVEEPNATTVPYPIECDVTALLGDTVPGAPDEVAVRCGHDELDRAGLYGRANHVAGELRSLGVGPGDVVGVHIERSVEMVVAILGVLRAGAAYLPLDTGYPRERLEFMLADSGAQVLLTGPGSSVLSTPGVRTLPVGRGAAAPRSPHAPAGATAGPDDIAYVIYTSGSTGRPKGVQVPHRGLVNRLLWMQDEYGLDPSDVVLQKTPVSFDVSVWELLWPLLAGARMVLAAPGGHMDPEYLVDLVEREQVTVCHFVPSMLDLFLSQPGATRCTSLRLVVSSGEALAPDLAARAHRTLPARLDNLYGPTEASIDVTRWTSRPGWDGASVPIGGPIANTSTYVLDTWMNPAPIGVPGELHLGGVQLARGYRARPGLTADRFVPNPFAAQGERLYRTGDLARWRDDGSLEYLGRVDDQVKVRGVRIEPGEIEAVLLEQAGVDRAEVVVLPDDAGDDRLVAYLRATGVVPPTADDLRRSLRERLPEHMVPRSVVVLDEFPVTANGKLDRSLLPAPDDSHRAHGEGVAPRDDEERWLASLWEDVLGVRGIGVGDNFFELGGDSMHAVRLAGSARARGTDIPVSVLFSHPTIEALAAWSRSRRAEETETEPGGVTSFGLLPEADLARLRG